MVNCLQSWPEPIVRVQSLADSGIRCIPERYIKRPSERPIPALHTQENVVDNIPVIDMSHLSSGDVGLREETLRRVSDACREWGFFQVVNHGVSDGMMKETLETWRKFFYLPAEEKQKYANDPSTYEGYGSRLGVEKGAILDWSDYFFLNYSPPSLKDLEKWPALPLSCRETIAKFGEEVAKLGEYLLKVLSINLGLEEDYLQKAFGGDELVGTCLRANYYPKCPQPDLTLGLSPHSDPGGMTLLLPDDSVAGLQVRKGNSWVTVKPIPNAFIVNMADQLQILSNGIYKSVEHRVMVNHAKERLSLAFFYNPGADIMIEPAKELVSEDQPALYLPMTFSEYRRFIRTKGPSGKFQVESLKSPR